MVTRVLCEVTLRLLSVTGIENSITLTMSSNNSEATFGEKKV